MTATDPRCPVCSEPIPGDTWVQCVRCGTPHHRDCFTYNQACAIYACGEDRFEICKSVAGPVLLKILDAAELRPKRRTARRDNPEPGAEPQLPNAISARPVYLDYLSPAESLARTLALTSSSLTLLAMMAWPGGLPAAGFAVGASASGLAVLVYLCLNDTLLFDAADQTIRRERKFLGWRSSDVLYESSELESVGLELVETIVDGRKTQRLYRLLIHPREGDPIPLGGPLGEGTGDGEMGALRMRTRVANALGLPIESQQSPAAEPEETRESDLGAVARHRPVRLALGRERVTSSAWKDLTRLGNVFVGMLFIGISLMLLSNLASSRGNDNALPAVLMFLMGVFAMFRKD